MLGVVEAELQAHDLSHMYAIILQISKVAFFLLRVILTVGVLFLYLYLHLWFKENKK